MVPDPGPVATSAEKSVVVLPSTNQSGVADNEYFSDGLTEEVISDLARLSGLRVVSRNSAMALKGTSKDTLTLAREPRGHTPRLGRRATGRRGVAGHRRTGRGAHRHAAVEREFSGTVADVFGIQERISREIVSALEVTLAEAPERQGSQRSVRDPVVYEAYLRARQTMYLWTPEGQDSARRLVLDAMDLVPDSPLLLATAAQIHWNQVNANHASRAAGLRHARDYMERALALDPDHPVGILVRGLAAGPRAGPRRPCAISTWPTDWSRAMRIFSPRCAATPTCRAFATTGSTSRSAPAPTRCRRSPLSS
jgi:adenylate cyclase